jgi:head-tail adaptor
MPIPSAVAKAIVSPKLLDALIKVGRFNATCTFQKRTTTKSGTLSITDKWLPVDGYKNIICAKFDRLPHEGRTADIIEELKFWTIMLAGYFPNVDVSWRVIIDQTGETFNVAGVDSDTQRTYTVVTARLFTPQAEAGV